METEVKNPLSNEDGSFNKDKHDEYMTEMTTLSLRMASSKEGMHDRVDALARKIEDMARTEGYNLAELHLAVLAVQTAVVMSYAETVEAELTAVTAPEA